MDCTLNKIANLTGIIVLLPYAYMYTTDDGFTLIRIMKPTPG